MPVVVDAIYFVTHPILRAVERQQVFEHLVLGRKKALDPTAPIIAVTKIVGVVAALKHRLHPSVQKPILRRICQHIPSLAMTSLGATRHAALGPSAL
jgi:hypothetical protein